MTITILKGNCRELLKTMPDESVHCCVTSPPYFGLRDYGTAKWEGGDAGCEHTSIRAERKNGIQESHNHASRDPISRECRLCGARRIDSQIGLEPTPDAYVAELVSVFREVRRVLRKDGTLWLNLGDSYAGGKQPDGIKPKDLIGIPWLVAFALRADGWYLRQDIIWAKPNPMPESVTDRCTKAHEYLFLLSKSPRYYYDAEAIKEPFADDRLGNCGDYKNGYSDGAGRQDCDTKGRAWNADGLRQTRNKRSVWEIATQPFSEAHFATFPPALIEPCIKAGCPADGTVLDPFAGAGTTGMVADRLGRDAILIELNSEYADMAERRITDDAGMFASIESVG